MFTVPLTIYNYVRAIPDNVSWLEKALLSLTMTANTARETKENKQQGSTAA